MMDPLPIGVYSRFYVGERRVGAELYATGASAMLPSVPAAPGDLMPPGTLAGKLLTIQSWKHPEDVAALMSVLAAREDIVRAMRCSEIMITSCPASNPGDPDPRKYVRTGEVVIYDNANCVLTLFLSHEGKLQCHPRHRNRPADYFSTLLRAAAHTRLLLASGHEMSILYRRLWYARLALRRGTAAWRAVNGSISGAEAAARILNRADPGAAYVREIAEDAWIMAAKGQNRRDSIWATLCARSRRTHTRGPGLDKSLKRALNTHNAALRACKKGRPPSDIFSAGCLRVPVFERMS